MLPFYQFCKLRFHKMLCSSGASAVLANGKAFCLGTKLLLRHFQSIFLRQMLHNGKVAVLIRLLEGNRHTEASGKAHQLLQGIIQMDIITAAFFHGFLHQMAAVACGINHRIFRTGGDTALQCCFQCGKMLIIACKA